MRTLTREDLARASLVAFSGYTDPSWIAYPHARLVAERLEDVERGRIKKLMVFLPGQHGKSSLVSKNFPAWYLGRHQDDSIILATYAASYASLWGRRARDVFDRFCGSLFGAQLRGDSAAADHWELRGRKGTLHTAGVEGAITGHSATGVIIDDPIKTREEAESATIREKTIEWYKSSVVSRRPKWQIVLMTRWHERDLAGWLLETERGEWTVVELPALAEDNDPLGRQKGDALCPVFLTRDQLLKIEKTVGSYVWASMWRQKPTPLGGGLFKRHHAIRYRVDETGRDHMDHEHVVLDGRLAGTGFTPNQMDRFVTVDTATSEEKKNCQTAISSWGVDPRGRLVLLDVDMDWIDAPEIMRRIVRMCARWQTISWIEENSTSKHLLQFMEAEKVPFRVLTPGSRSKFTRALPASAKWEQGQVLFPESAEWLDSVEAQLFRFTGADGDDADFVDTLSYAARVQIEEMQVGTGLIGVPTPKDRSRLPSGYGTNRPPGMF